ncbi:MAG: DUF2201 family putative metallopeptidase [Bacilli bacterium]
MDIDTIKRKTLVKYPFFGTILASTDLVEDYSIDTAATDGEKIYYNPNFILPKDEREQIFILAHEVCHIAFDHILRSEGKNSKIWNLATDGVINAFLKNDNLSLPKGVVDIPEALGYDAEELYEKLLKDSSKDNDNSSGEGPEYSNSNGNSSQNSGQENSENNHDENNEDGQEVSKTNGSETGKNGDSSSSMEQEDVGHDTHSLWEGAVEKSKKGSGNQQSDPENSQASNEESEKKSFCDKLFGGKDKKEEKTSQGENNESNLEQSQEAKEKEEEIKKISKMGEKKAFNENRIAKKKQLEELREILARQVTAHGDTTNSDIRSVEDIGTASALIPWRYLLKEAVKVDVDWSYQNAGIEEGVVTPYLEEFPLPETEILLDTSGSIDTLLLKNFLRECKNILQTSKVKAGCFDTEFYGFQQIRNENDINNMKFVGGGGTNFEAATNAFTRRVENKIIFTDGMARMPEEPMDIIWVVFGEAEIHPKGGKVIKIDERQLERLAMANEATTRKVVR